MRTIYLYLYFIFYMLYTLSWKIRLKFMRKYDTQDAVENYIFKVVSGWARHILKKADVKVDVTGNENLPEGSCLFVSNHQGNFDFFAMLAYINKPMGFIAKKEILKIPIIRSWMRDIHCVFIDRKNVRESVKAINEGIDNLNKGYSMAIFPEGTRSKGHNMGEFKKGSLKLATKTNVPVVPITVDGSYRIFEDSNGKKLVPGHITLIIGKSINVAKMDKDEKKNLSQIVRDVIQNNLCKIESLKSNH